MKKIFIKPEYIPLTQQRLCCVPCAIQWILLRRGLKLVSQEIIGKHLGLTVPPKYKHLYVEKIKIGKKKPKGGWGTTKDSDSDINNFFRKSKISLSVKKVPHSEIKDAVKLISDNLKKGNDIMAITYMAAFDPKQRFGHTLLICGIELGKQPKVMVGDPDFEEKKFYWLDLKKLVLGMDPKIGKTERAFYVFSKHNP